MSTFRLRWRFFWSRRSRRRKSLALLLMLVSLVAITYVAIPATWRLRAQDGLLAVGRGIRSLGLTHALVAGVAVCLVVSLLLIFLPTYKRHSYLTTDRHIIPPVSVYLDAENQLSEAAIRPFTNFLIKHLDGRRADLLYFLDASHTANGDKYKTLYRFGFRPIDVPHDPTGKGHVKEAVDRELAMHAFERAVLGPPDQEFIIVTGDADFVPLIYRLVALGHRVQVWAAPVREAYKVVETYLGINVIDLSQTISELEVAQQDSGPLVAKPSTTAVKKRRRNSARSKAETIQRVAAPVALSTSGEEHVYYGVAETLAAQALAHQRFRSDNEKNANFRSLLHGKYGPRLASIGYSAGNWVDYWLEHLIALAVLQRVDGHTFLRRGPGDPEAAARSLFATAELAARAALHAGASHADGLVRMIEIATAMAEEKLSAPEAARPLLELDAASNGKRITHTRYFVRSARALGLIDFDDVQESLDVIGNPRLPTRFSGEESPHVTDVTETSSREPDDPATAPLNQSTDGATPKALAADAPPAPNASREAGDPPTTD